MIELIAANHLKVDPKQRPHVVDEGNVTQVRDLFPKWAKERHGLVVYQCQLLDSSSIGLLTFAPRMFEGTDDKWHPANPHPHMDSVAGATSSPIDWVGGPNDFRKEPRRDLGVPIPARDGMDWQVALLDQCFIFQKGDFMVHLFTEALYDGAFGDLPATKQATPPKKKRKKERRRS